MAPVSISALQREPRQGPHVWGSWPDSSPLGCRSLPAETCCPGWGLPGHASPVSPNQTGLGAGRPLVPRPGWGSTNRAWSAHSAPQEHRCQPVPCPGCASLARWPALLVLLPRLENGSSGVRWGPQHRASPEAGALPPLGSAVPSLLLPSPAPPGWLSSGAPHLSPLQVPQHRLLPRDQPEGPASREAGRHREVHSLKAHGGTSEAARILQLDTWRPEASVLLGLLLRDNLPPPCPASERIQMDVSLGAWGSCSPSPLLTGKENEVSRPSCCEAFPTGELLTDSCCPWKVSH